MKHLSREALIDLLEETPGASGRAHLEVCRRCRKELEALGRALGDARAAEVPEPSPLFWPHLSERVRHAVDAEPAAGIEPARAAWWRSRGALSLAAAAVVLLVAAVVMIRVWSGGPSPSQAAAKVQPAAATAPAESHGMVVDEPWQLVAQAADGMDFDAASEAGMTVSPGSADQAAMQLSPAERRELTRLLEAELQRPVL
jgi:hypothetical protein